MNRIRVFMILLVALFISAVGTGVVMGWNEGPGREVAATDVSTTTSTVARSTTTKPTTTTSSSTTTTVATTTTTRAPVPTTTTPPPPATTTTTEPPPPETTTTTAATIPPTTSPSYDPVVCAAINANYADDPNRVALLQQFGCPPLYW